MLIKSLKGVGDKTAKRLEKFGIEDSSDLLNFFPRRYDDLSQIVKIADLKNSDEKVAIKAKIISIAEKPTRRRRFSVIEAIVADETGTLKIVWFNQKYLLNYFEAGSEAIFFGKISWDRFSGGLVLDTPIYSFTPKILPVYPEMTGISSNFLNKLISQVKDFIPEIPDLLPIEIQKKYKLLSKSEAILKLHFPKTMIDVREGNRRLAFDELFIFILAKKIQKQKLLKSKSNKIEIDEKLLKKFSKNLPYELTVAQKKAAWKIIKDLNSDQPMNRLLNGDVGSGKTVVAAMASLLVIKNGFRVALMVPTEILAFQHFETVKTVFAGFGVSISLVTSAKKIAVGCEDPFEADFLIGTQALIQKGVEIKNLGLVIVDEQHRFGVRQREALLQITRYKIQDTNKTQISNSKLSFRPHFLSMTATPIPRTMSLVVFADLDVSVIDGMPKERKKIITRVVPTEKRDDAYEFIHKQVQAGRQAFVICPLITNNEERITNNYGNSLFDEERKSVTDEFEKLSKNIFPDLKIAMLHGRMKSKDKEQILSDFAHEGGHFETDKKIDILVSTSVVEVGIDIPNASIMMIEDAERFGLAQLHQFRGRVGRAEHQSYCLLFSSSKSEKAIKRLTYMQQISSGFELAEKDLELRGPGQLVGYQQSGFWDFSFARMTDRDLISEVSEAADSILKSDPELKKHQKLLKNIEKSQVIIHQE